MKNFLNKIFISFLILLFAKSYIYADDEISEELFSFEEISTQVSSIASDEPIINARHAIVFDRNSKKAIYGKKETEKCKMASTTKIMTAIVIIENCSLGETVKVSKKSARNRWIETWFIHK